jgi:hypothetical protein
MMKYSLTIAALVFGLCAPALATERSCLTMKLRAIRSAISGDLTCTTDAYTTTDPNYDVNSCKQAVANRLSNSFAYADNADPPDGCTPTYDADSFTSDIEQFADDIADFLYFDYSTNQE